MCFPWIFPSWRTIDGLLDMVNRRGKTSASTRNKIQQFVFEWSLDRTEVCLICISIASSSPCVLLLKWNKRNLDGKITAKFCDQKLRSWMFEKPVNQLGWWFSLLCYLSRKFSLIIDWCVIYSLLHALKGLLNTIVITESVSRFLNESRTTKLVSVSHIFDQWTYLSMVMYSLCPILLCNIWSRGIVLTATWINTMSFCLWEQVQYKSCKVEKGVSEEPARGTDPAASRPRDKWTKHVQL